MLWPNNLNEVFGYTLFWWIPFYQPENEGEGFYYKKIQKPA
jgi:hypothetical protein